MDFCDDGHPRRAILLRRAAPARRPRSGVPLADQRAVNFSSDGQICFPGYADRRGARCGADSARRTTFCRQGMAILSGHDAPAVFFKEPRI